MQTEEIPRIDDEMEPLNETPARHPSTQAASVQGPQGQIQQSGAMQPAADEGASDGDAEPADAEPTEDELLERRQLILTLQDYQFSRLKKYLTDVLPPLEVLQQMSNSALKKLVQDVRYTVNVRSNGNQMEGMLKMGLHAVESIATRFTPLKLGGFANDCMSDDSILDTFAEVSLLYRDFSYVAPEKRLILNILRVGFTVHQKNVIMEAMTAAPGVREALAKPVAEEIAKKYTDL